MEKEQLTEFKIQLALPAPNIEIAQEVANKAQVLIDQFGYYQFLNLVDFMQKNPGAVSFGLNLIQLINPNLLQVDLLRSLMNFGNISING